MAAVHFLIVFITWLLGIYHIPSLRIQLWIFLLRRLCSHTFIMTSISKVLTGRFESNTTLAISTQRSRLCISIELVKLSVLLEEFIIEFGKLIYIINCSPEFLHLSFILNLITKNKQLLNLKISRNCSLTFWWLNSNWVCPRTWTPCLLLFSIVHHQIDFSSF